MLPRHLPPTAVPISSRDLGAGLLASSTSHYRFRAALASYFERPVDACRLASSGRSALFCLLKGLKNSTADRSGVIMPAYTCPVLPQVTIDAGLQPILVDLEPETMRYDEEALAASLGEDTLAVLLVHPFGIALPPEPLIELAHAAGAVVIEDAAQSMGARWNGRLAGTIADFGLFSLGPGKPISTAGGGIAIANDDAYGRRMGAWWSRLPPANGRESAKAWIRQFAFMAAFQPQGWWVASRLGLQRVGDQESGRRYSLVDLSASQAAVGLTLLPRLPAINEQRRKHAEDLASLATVTSIKAIKVAPEADAIYLRYPLLAEDGPAREALIDRFRAAGIGAGRLYRKSIPSSFPQLAIRPFPGAEAVAKRLLTLPTHHHMIPSDMERIHAILAAA